MTEAMSNLDLPFIGMIAAMLLAVPLALAAWRMIKGPGVADRFVALDMLTGVVVALAAVTALVTGRGAFLDIGLGVALINFVATVALSAFLERKGRG